MAYTSGSIFNSKDTVDFYKVNFCIGKSFIQCNTDSCYPHITGGVSINLYVCVNILVPVSTCVYLSVFMASNQNNYKNYAIRVKPGVNSMPCCIKRQNLLKTIWGGG